jgi:hypothetical protein
MVLNPMKGRPPCMSKPLSTDDGRLAVAALTPVKVRGHHRACSS